MAPKKARHERARMCLGSQASPAWLSHALAAESAMCEAYSMQITCLLRGAEVL